MKFSKIIVIASSIMLATSVCAQFNAPGGLQDKWGETDNNNPNTTIRRVGIGDFPPLSPPAAAFHINANLLTEPLITANNTFLAGEVFRTSGPSTNINAWRLFTGPGNGSQIFSLTVPANSLDAILSTEQNGAMRFHTNGTQRMYIQNGGITNGFIGIGSGFSAPVSMLHINSLNNNIGEVFRTTAPAGVDHTWRMNTVFDAFRFYIQNPANTVEARLVNEVNGEINFFTNFSGSGGARSVSFQNGIGNVVHGQVALGNDLPDGFDAKSRLHLHKTNTGAGVGANFIQYTNEDINGNSPDYFHGIRIGMLADGKAIIQQWNPSEPIQFFTGPQMGLGNWGAVRLHINSLTNTATEGFIGINNAAPTARLDINGDLRIREVGQVQSDALLLGLREDPNVEEDLNVRRLDFTGNANQYLAGTGGWATLPVVDASNGCAISNLNPGHVALGQAVGQGGNPAELRNNREIPMNNFNLYFTDNSANGSGANRIGIGTQSPTGRLHVFVNDDVQENNSKAVVIEHFQDLAAGNAEALEVRLLATGSQESRAAELTVRNGTVSNTGVDISTDIQTGQPHATNNYGVYAKVYNAINDNYGFRADVRSPDNMTEEAYGVFSSVRDANFNYGGRFNASGSLNDPAIENYGVYARAQSHADCNFGIYAEALIGIPNLAYAGFFEGDVYVNGNNSGTGYLTVSDENFKSNITDISSALQIIDQLQPRSFNLDNSQYPQIQMDSTLKYGFVAQEVETVLPELISNQVFPPKYDSLGNLTHASVDYKTLDYSSIIGILTKGIQEQQAMIDSLATELATIQGCLATEGFCQTGARTAQPNSEEEQQILMSNIDVILSNKNNVVLNQNVPNPFAEKTIITYSVPESIRKVQIHFYNAEGKLIQTVDIEDRGKGQLNVFADDLTSGIYMYTLVADGTIVDTKSMMKE